MSSSAIKCVPLIPSQSEETHLELTLNQDDVLFVLSPTQSTPLSSHKQPVHTNNIIFCWSGQRIYTSTGDGKVRILTFPEFEPAYTFDYKEGDDAEFTLNGHTSSCMALDLHPTNRYLASGGTDSLISLWDTTEWNCPRTITKMTGPVRSLSKCHQFRLARPPVSN